MIFYQKLLGWVPGWRSCGRPPFFAIVLVVPVAPILRAALVATKTPIAAAEFTVPVALAVPAPPALAPATPAAPAAPTTFLASNVAMAFYLLLVLLATRQDQNANSKIN